VDDRLYRSPSDRVIAGVASGMGAWIHVDPSIVRVAWVLGAIFSLGIFVLVYIVMMIVIPLAPDGWAPQRLQRATPGGDPVPGWGQGPAGPGPAPLAAGSASPRPPATWPQAAPAPAPAPAPAWQRSVPVTWDGARAARRGRLVGGTVLVIVGLWLLVGQYVDIDWNLLWPLVVMGSGALLVWAALHRRGS
jgi:phage shock protein C